MNKKIKRKILVVDDEINVCKSICQAILSEDYEVDTSLSGEEALRKDIEKNYDLIITDLMMPGISGMDLLKTLKTSRPDVNVIMITGYPSIKTAVQSIKIGAFDYISKPFTPNELRTLVNRAIKKIESEEQDIKEELPSKMPPGLFYMSGHTWLRKKEENLAVVGVMFDFLKTIETVISLELPKENSNIFQGEVCARITDSEKNIHRVWSPSSGRIVEVNEKLKGNYSLLINDPYHDGWLFVIKTTNLEEDVKGLEVSK